MPAHSSNRGFELLFSIYQKPPVDLATLGLLAIYFILLLGDARAEGRYTMGYR